MESSNFCQELREKTKDIHDKSDKLINLKLAIVLTDTTLYGEVLFEFYHVFMTLETALEQCRDHPHIGPLIFRQLYRKDLAESDLNFYLGDEWRKKQSVAEPTRKYCDRILQLSQEDPTLLIAYSHSMYLAILSGGQIIKKIMKRTLGINGDQGLDIFGFDASCNKAEIKRQFMDNINSLELSRQDKDRIIGEKKQVFEMNNAIAMTVKPSLKSYKRLIIFSLSIVLLFLVIIALFVWLLL